MLGRISGRPKLVEPKGFVSPTRAELELAIAEVSQLEAAVKAASADWDSPAAQAVRAARRAVEEKTEAVTAAKVATALHMQSTALGTAGAPPASIREARAALQDAVDTLEAAEAALAALASLVTETEERLPWARRSVERLALAVIGEEAAPRVFALAQSVTDLQRQMLEKAEALSWLLKRKSFPLKDDQGVAINTPEAETVRVADQRFHSPPAHWQGMRLTVVGATPWEAAFAALQLDANAPLPE